MYFVSFSIITRIELYFTSVIESLNFGNLTIKSQNINFQDISDITIIFIYL